MRRPKARVVALSAALLLAIPAAAPAAGFPAVDRSVIGPDLAQSFDPERRRGDRSRGPDRRIERFRPPPAERNGRGAPERPQRRYDPREQDRATDAVRGGRVLPLAGIIESARRYCPGTFLDASLEQRGNAYAYRVAILRPSGRRVVLLVDAASGAVVGGRCR